MILSLRKGSESPRHVSVNRAQALLGKHSECDVVLADPKVSRRHALITEEAGKIFIEDLGSTNGTVVAGQVASGRIAVGAEDAIEIGPFVLSVRAGTPAGSEANVTRSGGADKTRVLLEKPPAPKAAPPSRPETATGATRVLPEGAVKAMTPKPKAEPLPEEGATRMLPEEAPKVAPPTPKAAPPPPEEGATRMLSEGSPPAVAPVRKPPAVPPERAAAPQPSAPPTREAAAEPAAARRRPVPTLGISLGPLDAFLADDAVTEMMVNGADEIFIERGGRLELTAARFPSEETLHELVVKLAADIGRAIDERHPTLDARLRDGSRVHAVIPPAAVRGTYLTIRRFPHERPTPDQLVSNGCLSQPGADFLRAAVSGRTSLLVSGGTGAGKTTLLSALGAFLGAEERIITIEDGAELQLPQRHVLPLESKPGGGVTIRDLVRSALRMRPDRIVVGEVRGGEALELIQAMSTEHEGSLSTIHASSPREALSRLETLVLFAGGELPPRAVREQIARAIGLVVHTERGKDGKRLVTSIAELSGMEGDQFAIEEIFHRDKEQGELVATGYVPLLRDRLVEQGIAVDNGWFRQAKGKRK